MRGLTLTQPWATLIAIGAKKIETRSWATSYRGPLAIHAGAGLAGMTIEEYCALCRSRPHFGPALWAHYPAAGIMLRNERGRLRYNDPLPRGAIVAVARLEMCLTTDPLEYGVTGAFGDLLTDQEQAFGDYSPNRWGWLLADVRPLPAPIPCRGYQRLWDVPAAIRLQIAEALR